MQHELTWIFPVITPPLFCHKRGPWLRVTGTSLLHACFALSLRGALGLDVGLVSPFLCLSLTACPIVTKTGVASVSKNDPEW